MRFGAQKPFLTANWRYLAMLNYRIDPALLANYVPPEVELDFHEAETFISLVGFLFLETRLLGLPIPLHRNFEEVNLRFYLRRRSADSWRRGVCFIREIVPKRHRFDRTNILWRAIRDATDEIGHRRSRWQVRSEVYLAARLEMGMDFHVGGGRTSSRRGRHARGV